MEEKVEELDDQFVFRQGRSRETSYARDYDRLFELLKYEKEHGNIVWVMGPAFAFDADARRAMKCIIDHGYAHGLLATTVICMATMLHMIATGNMTPSFRVQADGTVRPVYFYTIDIDEFVVNKLLDRDSLSATTVVTNVQDFIMLVAKGLNLL